MMRDYARKIGSHSGVQFTTVYAPTLLDFDVGKAHAQ